MSNLKIQQWTADKPFVVIRCGLGEGPFYEPQTYSLRFVDIKEKRIHTVSLTNGPESLTTIQLDVPPSVTADVDGLDPTKTILVGLKHGIALLDRQTLTYQYVARFDATSELESERVRANDGAVDPHGRFWLGAMTDFGFGDPKPEEGALYRFTGESAHKVKGGIAIPNGIGWSPDHRTMYVVHSTAKKLLAFDYGQDGTVSNERLFYQYDGPGEPDGVRVDEEGALWIAVFGGGKVLRVSSGGEVIGEVKVSTRFVTCVQFVGTELYITTGADEDGQGESKEFGGSIFRVDVGVKGLEPFQFRL
ncbi:hypothetical protein ACRALDRAFT_1078327 [Sodiomyces alcalophilus JCM 7366]|uniref:uncharacterized protein n=1 Tax=Sodiomyces alcalophilus JCM 7366 TaxID=591952 RepID=UPI0039B3E176